MQNLTVYMSLSGTSSHLRHRRPDITGLCVIWQTWAESSSVLEWSLQAVLADLVGKDSHPPATIPFFLRAQGPQLFISAQIQCLSPVSPLSSHSQARAPGCALYFQRGAWRRLPGLGVRWVFEALCFSKANAPSIPCSRTGGSGPGGVSVPPRLCAIPSVGHRYTGASGS